MRTRPNFGIIGQASPMLDTTGIVKTLADYSATTVISTAQTNTVAIGNTATGGSSITYSGNYRIHTFTGSGTFTAPHTGYLQYLVVAGGGGGGGGGQTKYGGGGGGGGFLEYYQSDNEVGDFKGPKLTVNAGDVVTVVVGGGGAGYTINGAVGTKPSSGSGSYLYNAASKQYIYAIGGGGGGLPVNGSAAYDPAYGGGLTQGQAGGSGGGGALQRTISSFDDDILGNGGDAIGYPVQGYPGGNPKGVSEGGGTGGGAGGPGTEGQTGNQLPSNSRAATITGSSQNYSNGGGFKRRTADYPDPTANTGNGGHGNGGTGSDSFGIAGASGIVIIRYRFQ